MNKTKLVSILTGVVLFMILMPVQKGYAHGSETSGILGLRARLERGNGTPYYDYEIDFGAKGIGHTLAFKDRAEHHQKALSSVIWVSLQSWTEHYGNTGTIQWLNADHRIRVCFRGTSGCGVGMNRTVFVPAIQCGGSGGRSGGAY